MKKREAKNNRTLHIALERKWLISASANCISITQKQRYLLVHEARNFIELTEDNLQGRNNGNTQGFHVLETLAELKCKI